MLQIFSDEPYIRNNPVKARLVQQYTDWPYGSWRQ